jgi:predicted nucleic acid-binding Zn ribbon protein
MTRTLDNCKVIHRYGKPAQSNGLCAGIIYKGNLHEKCQACYLHDIQNATKVCIVCGKEFLSTNPNERTCGEECRTIRKNVLKIARRNKTGKKKHTFDDTLREIDEYNEKNGVFLTYGKYKEMLFLEELKNESNRK